MDAGYSTAAKQPSVVFTIELLFYKLQLSLQFLAIYYML